MGNIIIKTAKELNRLLAFTTIPNINAPKQVLPTSPIKTLAGSQFQKINPTREKTIKNIELLIEKAENKNTGIIFKQINPSRPSIKLIKFIIAVPKNIKKNKTIMD